LSFNDAIVMATIVHTFIVYKNVRVWRKRIGREVYSSPFFNQILQYILPQFRKGYDKKEKEKKNIYPVFKNET
jgi:hypothetical protein